jgi:hypothetical protein
MAPSSTEMSLVYEHADPRFSASEWRPDERWPSSDSPKASQQVSRCRSIMSLASVAQDSVFTHSDNRKHCVPCPNEVDLIILQQGLS